jgi:hypothetical protein
MSTLYDAFAWLSEKLTEHASVSVTYTRAYETITIDAVPGRPQVDRVQMGGKSRVRLDDEWLIFHIQPALIDFGLGAVEPVRGDRIAVGSIIREVQPMGEEPCVSRSDVSTNMWAVKTRRIA